ncbi:adenylate/guanylate cyclase domain-containing protein [Chitinivorax sp. B]|uniref:adenylate/guanylate cyclase domain-containing protein n=1 Tax=Chitinivorax sp. B TaxID=2502235 RepID=UPI0010FA3337|nr:adenylate/guanylate cyclase domain-containing protein [Chitinivorax sp. B]
MSLSTLIPGKVRQWLASFALLCVVGAMGALVFRPLDHALMDQLLWLYAGEQQPDPEILLIDIDDFSLGRMGAQVGRWPWPRAVHAEVLESMVAYQPRLVVFDILFSEVDVYAAGDSDRYFSEVLARNKNVLLPILQQNPTPGDPGYPIQAFPSTVGFIRTLHAKPDARAHLLLPFAVPPQHWRLGTINFVADNDGIGREYDVHRDIDGWRLLSMPAKVATLLGKPIPKSPRIVLNWRGREVIPFRRISYVDLYTLINKQAAGDAIAINKLQTLLAGRLVVIGSSASGLYDFRPTPIASQHPAVAILTTAIDNLKNGNDLRPMHWFFPAACSGSMLLMAWLLFTGSAGNYPRALLVTGSAMLTISLALLMVSYWLLGQRWLLPAGTVLGTGWAGYIALAMQTGAREYLARRRMLSIFSRFLDPKVVGRLMDAGELAPAALNKSCTLTVLFSDIRGFTTLAERHTAERVVMLLNRYFEMQVDIIFRHGGTLDKFIGDAVMAFWGAPGNDPQQAEHAIRAALDMRDALQQFRAELGEEGELFDMGVGIHTGPAVVGMIGSQMHYDYTVIGDTVNLASRIEGLTKGLAPILVSDDTRRACSDIFDFHDMGRHVVKGRHADIHLFEPRRRS